MANKTVKPKESQSGTFGRIFPYVVIPLLYVVALLIYLYVFGAPGNFVDGDNHKDPLEGNYLGIIYKGGWVVPILMTLLFTTIVFAVERFITIRKAQGTGNTDLMIRKLNRYLEDNDVDGAVKWCDQQRGSVASVFKKWTKQVQQYDQQ